MADAEKKGKLQQFYASSDHRVGYGRNNGQRLGDLGRRTIYGYAFLTPTKVQCEEALEHLNVLMNKQPEENDEHEQAENYQMKFGSRRGDQLGGMRPDTWKRLTSEVERDLNRMDTIDALRTAAQTYLRYTPDSFPSVGHDGLTTDRYHQLVDAHLEALEEFGALPDPNDEASILRNLTEDERDLSFALQRRYWKIVNQPTYFPIHFLRADAVVRGRDMGLLYDPDTQRYLLLVYLLHNDSQHKRPLIVRGGPYDVNNPDVVLRSSKKPVTAMLFELEMGTWQRDMLDAARQHTYRWKSEGTSSGSIRSARLHAHYDKRRSKWWFEVQLAVGFKPASILGLDGTRHDHFRLDEARIAHLVGNRTPEEQAQIEPEKRTADERNHRTANALVALCVQYQAQLGVEHIGYRRTVGPNQVKPQDDSSRTIVRMLHYKLPLAQLPKPVDVTNVSPRRDCGQCGRRHNTAQTDGQTFTCPTCGHSEHRAMNTAREVARRVLWNLATRKPPKQKHAPNSS
ncbi:MAG: zinc ribbon domain-containing protein [Chloroflexaceae bacterium]